MGHMRGVEAKMLIKKDVRAVWRALTSADFCPVVFNSFELFWNSRLNYRIERGKRGPGQDSSAVYHGDCVRLMTPRGTMKARFQIKEYVPPQRYAFRWLSRDSGAEPGFTKISFHLFDCGDARCEVTMELTAIARRAWAEMGSLMIPLGGYFRWRLRQVLRRLDQNAGE